MFEKMRFEIYCILLSEYLKKPTKELRKDLQTLKDGYIPVKYLGGFKNE